MIGSLVVTLPASFKGGALIVEHGGEMATYRSSKTSLSFVAFYADCRHQIRPIKSGHRIVLTYNLLLDGETDTAATDVIPGVLDALARCIDEHFTTPVPSRRGISSHGLRRSSRAAGLPTQPRVHGARLELVAPQARRRDARCDVAGGGKALRLRHRPGAR
jgi:hypothetical protein